MGIFRRSDCCAGFVRGAMAFTAFKRTAFPWVKTLYTQVEVKPER
jgi:hypothetical protein